MKDNDKSPTEQGIMITGSIDDARLTGPMVGKTLSDLIFAINSDDIYTNIHTVGHPDGEIRGQLKAR